MRFAVHTIGCKANQAESAALTAELQRRGHLAVAWAADADAYILNTCTVTAISDAKCRAAIRRIRREQPNAVVAVMGCLSQLEAAAVAELGADLVLGTDNKNEMPDRLEAMVRPIDDKNEIQEQHARTRTLLKVQDGCGHTCSYCIIPHARGPSRSVPLEDLLAQVRALQNVHEVVVTGIEIASWGRDLPGKPDFTALITELCRARPDIRFRLGSLEPRVVTEAWLAAMVGLPNLCRHFHLPLQSGCDATLARMKRRYNTTQYADCLRKLRAAFPHAAVTTDYMVGFPGEEAREWAQSLAFFASCGFADAHIFPYSRRNGTPAATMDGQLTRAVKKERAQQAAQAAAHSADAYAQACVGQTMTVLVEECKHNHWQGHADNYSLVRVSLPEGLWRNRLIDVSIIGHEGALLLGEWMDNGGLSV